MPTSAFAVLIFILAVGPGFLYELERRRRFTRPQESAFYEVSRALVASIVIGVPTAAVSFLSWWSFFPSDRPDFTALLKHDPLYVGTHAGPIALSLLVYIVVGFGIVGIVRFVRKGSIQSGHSIWYGQFRDHLPKGYVPVATVFMKSGAVWIGKVGTYSTEHEVTHRELVLYEPIRHADSRTGELTDTPHTTMILKGSEIEGIAVMYGSD